MRDGGSQPRTVGGPPQGLGSGKWLARLSSWDYLYFTLSVLVVVIGLSLVALSGPPKFTVGSDIGGALLGTGVVSVLVERILHAKLEEESTARFSAFEDRIRGILGRLYVDLTISDTAANAGIVRVIPSRAHYGRTISSFVKTATTDLRISAVALSTGVAQERIQDTFRELIERGVPITISFINPDNAASVAALARTFETSPASLKAEIEHSLERLSDFRDTLPVTLQQRFSLRTHDVIPFASGILIDTQPSTGSGVIQIESKPYRVGLGNSFALELRGRNDYSDNKVLYRTLREAWHRLFEDALEYRRSGR